MNVSRLFPVALLALLAGCGDVVDVTTACTGTRQYTMAWAELSDGELQVEVARACGRVFIGFKEAGTARGVDPYGKVLTSPETFATMREYVVARGVEIESEGKLVPYIVGRVSWTDGLVRELRHHPNVDYLEPIFPGVWAGGMRSDTDLQFDATPSMCTQAVVSVPPRLTGGVELGVAATYGAPNGGYALWPQVTSPRAGHLIVTIIGEDKGGIAIAICHPYTLIVRGLAAGSYDVEVRHEYRPVGSTVTVLEGRIDLR